MMNVTDVCLLLLGGFFIVRGIIRGFSGELISLISVVGGVYCALKFYPPLSAVLMKKFGLSLFSSGAAAMLGLFLLVFFSCAMLDKGLKRILTGTSLSGTDKMFGAIAGFIKIYMISLSLLIGGMILSPVTGDAWVSESSMLIATAKTWPVVSPILEGAGLLPDLSDLQREARRYIMRQASRRLFGTEGEEDEMGSDDDKTLPVISGDYD
jgi:membrane protein required for colicin V production